MELSDEIFLEIVENVCNNIHCMYLVFGLFFGMLVGVIIYSIIDFTTQIRKDKKNVKVEYNAKEKEN